MSDLQARIPQTGYFGSRTFKVWDPIVRLFHWSLVTAFAIAWFSSEGMGAIHHPAGYVVLGLLAVRLVWGLVGTHYARFRQFVRRPREVTGYLKAIVSGDEPRYLGHNPAGGAMIVALIILLTATGVTGWMMTLDAYWGVRWVHHLHSALANLSLVMIFLHVGGVMVSSRRHGENLVRAMIDGRKRKPATSDIA